MQQQQGYITGASMRFVATQIGCTPAEVEDVVSYYTMFYTKPVGKYVLNVCRTLSCALLGAERVTEELCAKLGIHPGQTTADGEFTVIEVECLGACDRAPVVMVNDDWHERLAPEQAAAFVDDIRKRGRAAFTGCHLHVEKSRAKIGTRQSRQSTVGSSGRVRPGLPERHAAYRSGLRSRSARRVRRSAMRVERRPGIALDAMSMKSRLEAVIFVLRG